MRSRIEIEFAAFCHDNSNPRKAVIRYFVSSGYLPLDLPCFIPNPTSWKSKVDFSQFVERTWQIANALNDNDDWFELMSLEVESKLGTILPPENLYAPAPEEFNRIYPELWFRVAGMGVPNR